MPRAASRIIGHLPAVVLMLSLVSSSLAHAQQPPTVEPRLTRMLADDSLNIEQVSVSPDGRWIVFSLWETADRINLWIRAASGGTPTRLTSGPFVDARPIWMPSGDRIVFISNRVARGESRMNGMTLAINPQTGRATDPPRQLTLDAVTWAGVRPSPDGRWIAYAELSEATTRIKVVPAMGGNPRVVADVTQPMRDRFLSWSSDGLALYVAFREAGAEAYVVTRVPASGGPPRKLFRTTARLTAIGPRGNALTFEASAGRRPIMAVLDSAGRALARVPLRLGMVWAHFTSDGRGLILRESRTTTAIRVVPVAGGPVRDITPGEADDSPLGWTRDGSAVVVARPVDSGDAIVVAPISGPSREIALPRVAGARHFVTSDGQVALYNVAIPKSDRVRLMSLDLSTRRETVLSEYEARGIGMYVSASGGEFYFLERHGSQVEIRATKGAGSPRVIRSFPANMLGKTTFAVHGNRVAWWEAWRDSSLLMVAEGTATAPRVIAAVAAGNKKGPVEIAWSYAGRSIVSGVQGAASGTPGATTSADAAMLVIDVPPPGQRATPRRIETGAQYWFDARWLPDDSGIAVVAGYGVAGQSHILLVPTRQGDAPVILTRDDPQEKWSYVVSPDGKLVAYPGYRFHGSAVWRADLNGILGTAGATKR